MVPSAQTVASMCPEGEMASAGTCCVCAPLSTCTHRPEPTAHTRAVVSVDTVTNIVVSGVKARPVGRPVWP